MNSQIKFNKGAAENGASGEFLHQSAFSQTDRNFHVATNSSLSKQRHTNEKLFLRELKVVFQNEQDLLGPSPLLQTFDER